MLKPQNHSIYIFNINTKLESSPIDGGLQFSAFKTLHWVIRTESKLGFAPSQGHKDRVAFVGKAIAFTHTKQVSIEA